MIRIEAPERHLFTRRELIAKTAAGILIASGASAPRAAVHTVSLQISDRLSPRNRKRPHRPYTRYIVLHTTEGEDAGSLQKVVRYGETHYFVGTSGRVYRVIDKSKIAKHAGRSIWEGRRVIDNYSVGIEVVGYHNRNITDAQYTALRELLRQLKTLYGISDENVLTHSMVAYGRPNRFYGRNHRGRKRCGMVFARPDVRLRMGLKSKPDRDIDVDAGHLAVADEELYAFLFARKMAPPALAEPTIKTAAMETLPESSTIDSNWTAWKIARERYDSPETVYVFPDGKRIAGNRISDWRKVPNGTRVILNEMEDTQPFEGLLEIGKDGDSAKAIAGAEWTSATTIYFMPDGLVRTGADLQRHASGRKLLENPPTGTRLLVGYIYGGYIRNRRPPSSIAGEKWNYPSTYYRYPDGIIISGDEVDPQAVHAGTLVFYQR
ncbi:MAG: hypothetical protein H6Q07_480 [Acidobacteria bacterium]|nr:hypothetical protein [Acidobacteriota bacterium]